MRKVDESQPSMPEIAVAKVCFIIEKSRELIAFESGELIEASAPDEEEGLSPGSPIRGEIVEFIDDLDEDEAAALVALAWIGRGDFEPDDWRNAVKMARERRTGATSRYVLGMELLPDHLEEALSHFGRSCEDGDGES